MISLEDQKWEENIQNLRKYVQSDEVERELMLLLHEGKTRLPIKLNALRAVNDKLVKDIIEQPQKAIRILQPEIQEKIRNLDAAEQGDKKTQYTYPTASVSFTGDLGRNLVTPRGLTSKLANQLVGVQGIVTKLSNSKQKLLKSVHYSKITDKGHVKEYDNHYDLAAVPNLNASKAVPAKDSEGNPIIMEDGLSKFIDTQLFILQELPETAPPGLLPRTIEVVLERDLVDSIKPGDRIQVIGVYKTVATQRAITQGIIKTILVATNVTPIADIQDSIQINADDIKSIKEQAKKTDFLEKIVNTIAPSIQGHDYIKQGILLQLLGGQEVNNSNGFHLRGDINILVIGDPSTAKSQMLRYVMNVAPMAINTTGRGSSGVGLTAAIKMDRESGQRTLEAGAMVLADRGIVCIDELDKMDEVDRVAIHEAMEQQTVTITKAGIHCTLNARCSVIAAANPVYGEYHTDLPPTENIKLPDSLLSRFDLLFIVLDKKDQESDRKIAERVTRNHMYRAPFGKENLLKNVREMIDLEDQDHVIQPEVQESKSGAAKGIFQKHNNLYGDKQKQQIYTQEFLQKYIKFAKKTCQPKLGEEAINYLSKKWKDLRQKDLDSSDIKVLPITTRTYESMIRISTAFAKLRLRKEVETQDCKLAYQLLKKSLFGDDDYDSDDDDDADDEEGMEDESYHVKEKKTKKRTTTTTSSKKQSDKKQPASSQKQGFQKYKKSEDGMDEEKQQQVQTRVTRQSQQKAQETDSKQPELTERMQKIKIVDDSQEASQKISQLQVGAIKVTRQERIFVFQAIGKLLNNTGRDSVSTEEVWDRVKGEFGAANKEKMIKCLYELEENNQVEYVVEEDTIYII